MYRGYSLHDEHDKMNENSNDQLLKAIKTVQNLRSCVASVFEKLENGIADTTDPQGREKVFLSDLQQRLVDVNEKLGLVKSSIIAQKIHVEYPMEYHSSALNICAA